MTLVISPRAAAALCEDVPRLTDLGVSAVAAAKWADHREALIEHAPCDFVTNTDGSRKKYFQIRFITGLVEVPAAAESVRALLGNPEGYAGIFPNTDRASLVSRNGNQITYELRHAVKLPLITWHTTLRSRLVPQTDGSLRVDLLRGDIDASAARWEILPLDKQRTLVVFTNWSNVEGTTWLYRLLLKAQPDLPAAMPWVVTSSAIESVRRRLTPQVPSPRKSLPSLPEAPTLKNRDTALDNRFVQNGNVALISPDIWFSSAESPQPLRFVTILQKINAPMGTSRRLLSSFQRYHEFLKPVKSVAVEKQPWGLDTRWKLGMSLGIFSTSPEYRMSFWWQQPDRLYFHRTEGDIKYLFGAWEWEALGTDATRVALSTGFDAGPNPGWMMGYIKYAPYPEINGPLLSGLLTMKKATPWIEKQNPARKAAAPQPSAHVKR